MFRNSFTLFIVIRVILSYEFDVIFEQADERISHPSCNGPPYRFLVYRFADLKSVRFIFIILSTF